MLSNFGFSGLHNFFIINSFVSNNVTIKIIFQLFLVRAKNLVKFWQSTKQITQYIYIYSKYSVQPYNRFYLNLKHKYLFLQ